MEDALEATPFLFSQLHAARALRRTRSTPSILSCRECGRQAERGVLRHHKTNSTITMKHLHTSFLLFAALLTSCSGPVPVNVQFHRAGMSYAPPVRSRPQPVVAQPQPASSTPSDNPEADQAANLATLAIGAAILYGMFGGGFPDQTSSVTERDWAEHSARQEQNRRDIRDGRPQSFPGEGH